MSRWIVRAAAAICAAGYVFVYASGRAGPPIRSDGFSYYVYLPSWFIYHDTSLAAVAQDCCGGQFPDFTAIIRWPGTRRWVNAHPIGVAIMQTPFFLVAHALTRWTNLSADGFTFYYQHAAGVAGLAWIVAGLWVLRRLLLRHFPDTIVAATLAAILFGTNLLHYATYDSSYSHPYSFFLFAAFLDLTERWHLQPAWRTSLLLGLVGGLIVLVRHTNALFLVFFPLYGVTSAATMRVTVARLRRHWQLVAAAVASVAITVAPQLALYHQATGRSIVSSYGELGFNFFAPQLWGVLFSVQKGVFFWSPILLLAVAGLAMTRGAARGFLLPAALFLTVNTYLIASWFDWQFGGSFGHRGFVDALPVFAIGLASLFSRAASSPAARATVIAVCAVLIALSLFQMLQYWNGVLPFSDTTWPQYRAAFLRLK